MNDRKALLDQAGITSAAIARASGIDQNRVWRHLMGQARLSESELTRIREALGEETVKRQTALGEIARREQLIETTLGKVFGVSDVPAVLPNESVWQYADRVRRESLREQLPDEALVGNLSSLVEQVEPVLPGENYSAWSRRTGKGR